MILHPEPVTGHRRRRADLLPILTLFLLLLAFFALLGSISKFEINRTQVVLGSLSATFRTTDLLGERREFGSLSGQILGAEKLESTLDLALRTAIGIDRFELRRVGNRVSLGLAAEHLFEGGSAEPQPGLVDVADIIADALSVRVPGVEFWPETLVDDFGNSELGVDRTVAVGRALVAAGIERNRLAVGLEGGVPGGVEIVFRVRVDEGRP